MGGGGVPEMLARLKRGDRSDSPRWERFAMRLLVGHLLAYSIPGMERQPVSVFILPEILRFSCG